MSNDSGHTNEAALPRTADKGALLELADTIEKFHDHFDMQWVYKGTARFDIVENGHIQYRTLEQALHPCGSSACIQGFMELKQVKQSDDPDFQLKHCIEVYGMDEKSFDAMCYPTGHSPQGFSYIRVEDGKIAAEFLRRVVASERVDWSLVDDLIDAQGKDLIE